MDVFSEVASDEAWKEELGLSQYYDYGQTNVQNNSGFPLFLSLPLFTAKGLSRMW